jgi:prevent-host-death family protein
MASVGIRALKQSMGDAMRRVRDRGKEIEITSRGK